MSKYADIEQIKEVIRTEWCKYMPSDLDINLSFVLGKIAEVPTIEVEEDCISRSKIVERIEKYKEPCMRPSEMWLIDDIIKVVEKAQSIVPRESEE